MRRLFILLSFLFAWPMYAFGGTDMSLMQPGVILEGACVQSNLGLYDGTVSMTAVYEPMQYDCEAGQYLPANAISCKACDANSYCVGGTFTFSENSSNGITPCPDDTHSRPGSKSVSDCDAYIVCAAGEYLPANSNDCAECLVDNYCPGGDFVPSADDSGIFACADGLVSPVGTTGPDLCGKELHVGDDIIYLTVAKQTTPALVARVDDVLYYAKMTPVSEGQKYMNGNTDKSLVVNVDGIEYYIHDNTMKGE